MTKENMIRDPELADEGRLKIDWVEQHMPVLDRLAETAKQKKPFSDTSVAICLHLEAKTAYLAQLLHLAGAEVTICGSNPLSTQDDVAAALAQAGVRVNAWHAATDEEYAEHIARTADTAPDLILDDGGDLVSYIHKERRDLLEKIRGGSEETTTGVNRLRAMEREERLCFPMFATNDALCKYLFDNRYGTGESTWSGIMGTTNLVTAGKTVVVAGYGWCGRGVAMRADGLGARVIVCEVDPVRANEALLDGYQVMPMEQAAERGDIFVTVTGCRDVISEEHFLRMKDGAVLSNAGHFDLEIDVKGLSRLAQSSRRVRENIDEYVMEDGRRLHLLAEGRLVNLAAGNGHPAEIMDMSFALQYLTLEYIKDNYEELKNRVYSVPDELDTQVAELRLRALDIEIDRLTAKQEDYLTSWE